MAMDYPSLHVGSGYAVWPSKNFTISQKSAKKRWGYSTSDRDLEEVVYKIVRYVEKDTTVNTLYLTETNLARREGSGSNTFSYKTETYTTGTISSITGTTVEGSGVDWSTAGIAAGDMFIMDSDHSSAVEPDANWVAVESVTDADTLELASSYTKNGTSYKLRKVYAVPSNERWWHCIVDDKFCFGNGSVNTQYWAGTGYAADLDSTYAIKARYGIEFGQRLVIADLGSTRDPVLLRWSKLLDPTDWTDSSAGYKQFLESEDYIVGLGKVGTNIVVYKEDSIVFGNLTGNPDDAFEWPSHKRGIGLSAPYSIVEVMGTNAFIGKEDFYVIDGGEAVPLKNSDKIKDKFFDIVGQTEVKKTFGFRNDWENEIAWVANTTAGKFAFVYNYKNFEWYVYEYAANITGFGKGEV